jgi:predicted TIM-barrel fold metal-dependent hydrolase
MTREYRYITGDTHLELPAERWTKRVPEKYRDRAPRTVRLANGGDAMLIEGQPLRENPMDLYGGKGRDVWHPWGQTYESTPGTAGPEDRLKCLDIDGLDAEVMFPAVVAGPRTWRSIRDDDVYVACVRAYNDFIAEEYAAFAPDRFLPVGVIPMTNLDGALEEMQRCKELGLHSVMLGAFPGGKGWPTRDDDAFWRESLAINMPVTIHVDLDRSGPRDGPLLEYKRQPKGLVPNADMVVQCARFAMMGGRSAMQLILSGLFDRLPELRVFLAENQLGWIPLYLTVADERYQRHVKWAHEEFGWEPLENGLPSDYVRRNILWGFQHDPTGVQQRQIMGVENLIWGSDFPHQESEYPHSLGVIERNFAGVPEDEKQLMVCGNAMRFFGLN